jgi:hypothetical protein
MILRINSDEDEGISVETLLDCTSAEFLDRHGRPSGKLSFFVSGNLRTKRPLESAQIVEEVAFGDFLVRQYETATIEVLLNGHVVKTAKPELRKIAAEISVDLLNGNGNAKNTRSLGADIIKVLKSRNR